MKSTRTLALLLAVVLALSLTACGAKSADTASVGAAAETAAAADAAEGYINYSIAEPGMQMEDWNTEEYSHIQENRFQTVAVSPLSTFAADVDTASYANLRRMLLAGEPVPADAVRIEEMINYFQYNYPEPEGDEPFSVTTEITPCPWNDQTSLLRVGLQAEEPDWETLPASNLVFLIDVSGSMNQSNKLPLVKQAFRLLTENLRPEDTISIVTYASQEQVVLDGATGDERADIQTAIENLTAGGSTAGSKGITTAYELARKHFIAGGNNRVILATDGDLNVGVTSEGELVRLIEKEKKGGVFLSVLGFGDGNLKDNKLEALADHGDGNYAYIDSALEAKRVLMQEMGGTLFTVAKDVKFQVEFNPEKVAGYRLIGYENRLMAAEDFADDAKDGGEVGAGHRVTVLYELAVPGADVDIPGVDLKYQQTEATGSDEWLTVSMRYKEPEGGESILLEYPVGEESVIDSPSQDTAFAACVAQFGMLLRESEYAGTATYDSVVEQLSTLPGVETDDFKAELLYLVRQMARRS